MFNILTLEGSQMSNSYDDFWGVVPSCSLVEVCRPFVLTASLITLTMEAVSTSETSINIYQLTRCNIP
jgi:hypothetical protein